MTTISLCMIVKDEEKFLADCLNSVKGLVDEIIIVDTGSTDKTKEIALSFGAKVFDFEWCDDFAAARNESLKQAKGDWILVLDADEVLAERDLVKVKDLVESSEAEGYVLSQRNYFKSKEDLEYGSFSGLKVREAGQGGEGFVSSENDGYQESKETIGWMLTPIVRLFRNKDGVQFSGAVHEDVFPSVKGRILDSGVPVHHYGKMDSEGWKKKWELYEKLGEKKAAEEKDYYAYFELGRQYLENKKIGLAKEMFEKSTVLKEDFWLSWFNLGSIALMEGELDLAIKKLEKAQGLNPRVPVIYNNLGVAYARKKEFGKAIHCFAISLQLKPEQAEVYKNLGTCYHESGDKKMAYLALKKAVELNPEYRKEIKLK